MNTKNVPNLPRQLSFCQTATIVLASMLIADLIIDNDLACATMVTELLIHTHIMYSFITDILHHSLLIGTHALGSSMSIIGMLKFSNISLIYTIVVSIICITSVFYFIDHKKLTSRFSTLHFDTLFRHHKEVAKAFISIP